MLLPSSGSGKGKLRARHSTLIFETLESRVVLANDVSVTLLDDLVSPDEPIRVAWEVGRSLVDVNSDDELNLEEIAGVTISIDAVGLATNAAIFTPVIGVNASTSPEGNLYGITELPIRSNAAVGVGHEIRLTVAIADGIDPLFLDNLTGDIAVEATATGQGSVLSVKGSSPVYAQSSFVGDWISQFISHFPSLGNGDPESWLRSYVNTLNPALIQYPNAREFMVVEFAKQAVLNNNAETAFGGDLVASLPQILERAYDAGNATLHEWDPRRPTVILVHGVGVDPDAHYVTSATVQELTTSVNILSFSWGRVGATQGLTRSIDGVLKSAEEATGPLFLDDAGTFLEGAVDLHLLIKMLGRAYAINGISAGDAIHLIAHSQGTLLATAALSFDPPGESYDFGKSIFIGANINNLATEAGREFSYVADQLLDVDNLWSETDRIVTLRFSFGTLGTVGAGNGGFFRDIVQGERRVVSRNIYDSGIEPNRNLAVRHTNEYDDIVDWVYQLAHPFTDTDTVGWWEWIIQKQTDRRHFLDTLFSFQSFAPNNVSVLDTNEQHGGIFVDTVDTPTVIVPSSPDLDIPLGGIRKPASPVTLPREPVYLPTLPGATTSLSQAFRGEWIVVGPLGEAAGPGRRLERADVYFDKNGNGTNDPGEYLDSDRDPAGGFRVLISTVDLESGDNTLLIRVVDDRENYSNFRSVMVHVDEPGSPPDVLPASIPANADSEYQIVPHRNGDISYDPAHYTLGPGKVDLWEIRPATGGGFSFETTGSTDTVLGLYDRATGQLLAFDENNGSGNNAQIVAALQPGVAYVLAVVSQNGDSGNYGLNVTGANQMIDGNIETLPALYQGSVADTIAASYDTKYYRVETPFGATRLDVRLQASPAFNGFVRVENHEHVTIRTAFVAGAGLDDVISDMAVTSEEILYITVTGIDGTTGTFTLDVDFNPDDSGLPNELSSVPDNPLLVPLPDGCLSLDDENISSPGELKYYLFSTVPGESGEFLIETHGDLDTQIAVYRRISSTFTELVVHDDDSGVGTNARVMPTILANEVYVIVVRADGSQTGNYDLDISGPPSTGTQNIQISGLESSVDWFPNSLDGANLYSQYQFSAPTNASVLDLVVDALPGEHVLDLGVRLSDAEGNILAVLNEGGMGIAEQMADIPVIGGETYYLTVWAEHFSMGEYQIHLDFDPDFDGGTGVELTVNSEAAAVSEFPAVGRNSSGQTVVVWVHEPLTGDPIRQIAGQRFGPDGSPIGEQFQVMIVPPGSSLGRTRVEVAEDGSFIVAYDLNFDLYFRRFDANLNPLGGETKVNLVDPVADWRVDMGPSGQFAFVWSSDRGSSDTDIVGQRFLPDGTIVGEEILINTSIDDYQLEPDLAISPDGTFGLVVWQSDHLGNYDIFGQAITSSGEKLGSEFRISTATSGNQTRARIDVGPDGVFTVVWMDNRASDDGGGIYARRIGADLAFQGDPIQVNTNPALTNALDYVEVAAGSQGKFLVTWVTNDEDQSGIAAQRFGANGIPLGPEYVLNQTQSGPQSIPAVASDGASSFFAVWRTGNSSIQFFPEIDGIVVVIDDIIEPELEVLDSVGPPEDRFIDLGASQPVEPQFLTIRNTGNGLLAISDLEIYGADADFFSLSDTTNFVLQPGESRDLTVSFSATEGREYFAAVRFTHNDQNDVLSGDFDANPYWISLLAEIPDTIPPTVQIVDSLPALRNDPVGVITIDFSEPVVGFSAADCWLFRDAMQIDVTGLGVTAVTPSLYTIDLSSVTEQTGHYELVVWNASGNVYDLAGNPLANFDDATWDTDTSPPLLSISIDPPDPFVELVVFEFTEDVVGFDIEDLRLTQNGVEVPITGTGLMINGSGSYYTFSIGSLLDQGTYVLTVVHEGSGIQDLAGNLLEVDTSRTWITDYSAPTPAIELPELGLRGNNQNGNAVRGQDALFTLSATDSVPVNETFRFRIDWENDGIIDEEVIGPSEMQVTHTYTEVGNFTIRLNAIDEFDNPSDNIFATVRVTDWDLRKDPSDPTKTDLVIGGTTGVDAFAIIPGFFFTQVLNGQVFVSNPIVNPTGSYNGRVIVYGQSGDDLILADVLNTPIVAFGGDGNDVLVGGRMSDTLHGDAGNDMIFGGSLNSDGDDLIFGGAGNDLIVGNLGADTIHGGGDGDLIVAGSLYFESKLPIAAYSIQSEWLSARPLQTKADNILGSGVGTRNNGTYFLTPGSTLLDDERVDEIFGDEGDDWLVVDLEDDVIDALGSDLVTDDS